MLNIFQSFSLRCFTVSLHGDRNIPAGLGTGALGVSVAVQLP